MEQPIVTVNQGQLRGYLGTDFDGGKIYSFHGIPYAKPPVGELRFKAPVAAESWSGIRDATKDGDRCYSRDLLTGVIGGSEDCLNLNVFTKSLPGSDQKLKPVMVWIHGGGFVSGSNETKMYGPEFLLTEDIVLVSINYRLGVLGFLSLKDTALEVPGNAGLKDQVLALKWVQSNIKNFNGDPDNVTIFGESAGSASVHYHILSSSSKGLFHKAILQSGVALNHWTLAGYVADEVVKELNQVAGDEKEILQILRSVSVDKLYEAQLNVKTSRVASVQGNFAPVIEKPNNTAFITRNAIDIIRSGEYNKVPIIIGYNTREGMLMAVYKFVEAKLGKAAAESPSLSLEDSIPWQINLKRGSDTSKLVSKKILDLYFKGPNLEDNVYLLTTDASFVAGILGSVKNHLATSQFPIYLYRMSLEAELNVLKNYAKLTNQPGVCHADDLGYLFKNAMTPTIKPGSLEDNSVRRFVKLWTNFAKHGNPTPDKTELGITWKPVKEGSVHFLDIGEELTLEVNPEPERVALWREIYQLNPETAHFL